jgi:hypothetical protein
MLEPWRSRYLQAMGVDIYLPRLQLPGARESVVCGWDATAIGQMEPAEAVVAPAPTEDVSTDAIAAPPAVRRATVIDVELARPAPAAPVSRPPARADADAIPHFSLQLVRTDIGVLVVDDAPGRDSPRADYQRFIANLLYALYRRQAQISTDLFLWPMAKNPSQDHSEQAARESLGARLHRELTERGVQTLLVLGETAAHWVDRELPALHGVSGWVCLGDGAAKRQLWLQLLAQRAE